MPDSNLSQNLYNDPFFDINTDIRFVVLNKFGPIAKKRENLMPHNQFCELMRMANDKQRELLLHVILTLLTTNRDPFQIFFTGPAGCGKTFVIKILMEIYNRYTDNDGYCNSYIACASTGKAAVAIDGTTIHTALKISLSKLLLLSIEIVHQYRALFKYVKVLIIDEISMISAERLAQIYSRLKQITGNFNTNFGGLDIILIRDLRQLPPVRATPIYKHQKQRIVGPILWRGLKFSELDQVRRQANQQFSSILTKIGSGEQLSVLELALLESRFVTTQDAETKYKIASIAKDVFTGCTSAERIASFRQCDRMSLFDTGLLPYEIIFVKDVFYIITTNIDVSDGLANGAVGKLVHIEYNEDGEVNVVWLEFPHSLQIGQKIKKKVAGHVADTQIKKTAVLIGRRSATISLNNNKTINVKRSYLPLICACATTTHKSQGSTYPEVVYEYDKKHQLTLVYVALSRVTTIEGLYITAKDNDNTFYHGRRPLTAMISFQDEYKRLSNNRLVTISKEIQHFMNQRKGLKLYTLNCQSLRAHLKDMIDSILQESKILMLSET
ncbi:ATP-dependent DNA helicase pfh1-like [Polistes fuscatus]|uniref:ATP-dependent DNA helicase pfh1-like n=1 Tax=Polistes fuscatus TaxID=30207 RepID=UPI001CA8135C|nr:ATP-dependent DNA helicase pfh1-like [Polistes fuscatus]